MRILLLLFTLLSSTAQGEQSTCETLQADLVGYWQYDRYSYQGSEHPRPNPRLLLYFQFFETGTKRIWWRRTNEQGYCERVGTYTYNADQCTFTDKIVWVNPENNAECGSDPDMRLGRTATSRLELNDGSLHLYFELKGELFVYIFERVGTTEE
ncbi:MAG: hypothetical protein HRT45_07185 [Bdellovibrionales bacterium]|nr:hypothetical protein [Bdellovibrionales bacterium]